ncbi:MAG: redoxin domain-containing protein [Elusimicrobia bacterium]|nr:redoxin domain-containing protein [Elusimicrobiota bacterium]
MWMVRRALSANWLYAVLAQIYPPLRTVPLGALFAAVSLVLGFWFLSQYVLGHSPASLSVRTLPAVLVRKPRPGQHTIPLGFALIDREGRTRPVASVLGPGRTLIYFYSPYCAHCAKMLPDFLNFALPLVKDGVSVVGVQYQGSVQLLAQSASLPDTLYADPKGEFCGAVGVGEFTVFVVDAEGRILLRSSGSDYEPVREAAFGTSGS